VQPAQKKNRKLKNRFRTEKGTGELEKFDSQVVVVSDVWRAVIGRFQPSVAM